MAPAEPADAPPPLSLSDFDEPVLLSILRQLEGPELAKLCVQDRRLRLVASEQALWQALALARWPNSTEEHHGGCWQQLYRHRATLPPAFVTCVDRAHALTASAAGRELRVNSASLPGTAGGPHGSPAKPNVYGFASRPYASIPGMLFDQVMQLLFSLCLWRQRCTSERALAAMAREMGLVKRDMAWWLVNKPEAVVQFVKRSQDLLRDWDMWGSGFTSWPEVLWRRSAIQFLLDLHLGLELGVCPSVTNNLLRELEVLDEGMRGVDGEGSFLASRKPEGLPAKHWWYGLRGQLSGSVC
ncbi:hypothetical protein HT031_003476 [Scenedesmus sp. PABB004]|nr:hypothetical protein HT031_003476 [Scenedesmus sp. PABB004]